VVDGLRKLIRTGAGQQLVRVLAVEVGEDGLQVGLAERPHRPTQRMELARADRSASSATVSRPVRVVAVALGTGDA